MSGKAGRMVIVCMLALSGAFVVVGCRDSDHKPDTSPSAGTPEASPTTTSPSLSGTAQVPSPRPASSSAGGTAVPSPPPPPTCTDCDHDDGPGLAPSATPPTSPNVPEAPSPEGT